MTRVGKALWYIESHFNEAISLDDIAAVAGVSRFHMSRAFSVATGQSILTYIRGRRLTEAARKLADGAPDILSVALEASYNSHEAFTRAFGLQFGVTPETLRSRGTLKKLELVEPSPMSMSQPSKTKLVSPRMVEGKPLLVTGLSPRSSDNAGMPAQWQRFVPYLGNIPGQVRRKAYGVLYNGDDSGNIDYMCGVEVKDFSDLPAGFAFLRIPAQYYAVFPHREHISTIQSTWMAVFNDWLPASGYELADGPEFELYGEDFDGVKGIGTVEIWVPIKR
jgi:AraC family transcriptional regulator